MAQETKRNHVIPKYYLRGFTRNGASEEIYQFERGKDTPTLTTIKKTGVRKDFYTLTHPDGKKDRSRIESWLTSDIENPANPIIEKIRKFKPINDDEKNLLSKYMSVMATRVESYRKSVKQRAPIIGANLRNQLDRHLDELAMQRSAKKDQVESRRRLIHDIIDHIVHTTPNDIAMPRVMERWQRLFMEMNWRFLHRGGEHCFITSDNPLFFDLGVGLNHPTAEVLFPISNTIMLWATKNEYIPGEFLGGSRKHHDRPQGFWQCSRPIIRSANELITRNATRFVWAWTNAGWVTQLLRKTPLSEIWEE